MLEYHNGAAFPAADCAEENWTYLGLCDQVIRDNAYLVLA